MSWFSKTISYTSEISGQITCRCFWGGWQINAGGCYQTADYTVRMWHKVLKCLPKNFKVKNVLILGLGGGGNVSQLYNKFSNCQITAVELDPVMAEIAKKTYLAKVQRQPRIILGDASKIIKELSGNFDLILVDIYVGKKPARILLTDDFINNLWRLLDKDGFLLLNAFSQPEIFHTYDLFFSRNNKMKFHYNQLAAYRHFGHGKTGDPLPPGYVHIRQSRDYLLREGYIGNREVVGNKSCPGLRWHHGPFYVESYVSDQEPDIKAYDHSRLVIWQPIARLDSPKPWRRSWAQMNSRKTGFALIRHPDYWNGWTSHAQRQRKKWLKNSDYYIEETTMEEFISGYKGVFKLAYFGVKNLFIDLMRKTKKFHGDNLHFFIIRNKETKKNVAGLAVLDIPEIKQSHHFISYLYKEAEASAVGTGLIDAWFKDAVKKQFQFLDFGLFWAPGNSRSWKGFSNFKGQFGTRYIAFPYPLLRWVRKNKY